MNEMLGNQYFMARNYKKAETNLEYALKKDPKNKNIRRKLIVCHTQTGNTTAAMEMFLSLVKEDIDFIINTDPIEDDCPCPELVFDIEKTQESGADKLQIQLVLGMLWLFCSLERSINHFQTAHKINPDDRMVKSILTFLLMRQSGEVH